MKHKTRQNDKLISRPQVNVADMIHFEQSFIVNPILNGSYTKFDPKMSVKLTCLLDTRK